MQAYIVPMYIESVPNRNSPPAVLLREGWRKGKKVHKRTIANLSHWPKQKIDTLRRLLKEEPLMSPDDAFEITRTLPHGHVEAVVGTLKKIGFDSIIASKPSRERDLVVAMIVQRVLHPCSKLATTRSWHNSTLAQELGVQDADEHDLYEAMDWLLERQERIEKKLATKHLSEGCQVLYDVSSSYYEGHTCPLAQWGHNRDKKKGKRIIVYGVLTDHEGRPVAAQVYPGNTADTTTVPDQVHKLQQRFGLERVVLVGDRGMITYTQIQTLKTHPGIGWISALRSDAIRQLLDSACLQMSLFDDKNLAEISSPHFPGERLVACFNPLLAQERSRKRLELLDATEKGLTRIAREAGRRIKTRLTDAEIGQKVGRVINQYKVAKHFKINIKDGCLTFERREQNIRRESELDGIYVVRTSEPSERLGSQDTVRSYKHLTLVEWLFRCLKGIDLLVRPLRHRLEDRVRAHIFLCVLAYYVQWHMRIVLAPLLFNDEQVHEDRLSRDPVAPARPSESAKSKKTARLTPEGFPIHSFETLLEDLATRCRNTCKLKTDPNAPTFFQHTNLTPLQHRAFELLGLCSQ
jgi:transposase